MKFLKTIGVAALAAFALAGCATVPSAEQDFQAAKGVLAQHIQTLAAPDFAGREPGTEGGRKTQQYLVDALSSYGFQPGASMDSWRQPVVLTRAVPGEATVTFGSGVQISGDDVITRIAGAALSITDSRVTVFAPGAKPPPEGSQKGRSAVIFGDAFLAGQGRELSPSGFDAIYILFEEPARFARAKDIFRAGRWTLEQMGDRAASTSAVTPYVMLSPEASQTFAQALGNSLGSLRTLADEQEGKEFQRRTPVSLVASSSIERAETANVIGKLPGKVLGSGAVLVLAHWDHLGTCGPEGAEDRLCNGAVDNASGIGVMLETARRIAAEGPLDRDLYIIGTTAEELGLLGAQVFAADPPMPLPTIVAAFNIDTVAIAPRGALTTVVGWGRTPLDKGIKKVVESIGGTFAVIESTEQFVRRQDGWALLSRDVPAVLVSTSFGDEKAFNAFLNGPYHQANDEWRDDLELGGATDDIFTHVALLKYFGSTATYQPGTEPVEE